MDDGARAQILDGLNVFRALEIFGATLYAAWAADEPDAHVRAGHLIIAEREATHARLLAERIRVLGGTPGPACVDDVIAAQLAELKTIKGFVAQLDAFKACSQRDAERMASCRRALDRAFEAAKATDPATHQFLSQLYSEEEVSAAWYRHTYSEISGKRPRTDALPVLTADQIVRRAESARDSGEHDACTAGIEQRAVRPLSRRSRQTRGPSVWGSLDRWCR